VRSIDGYLSKFKYLRQGTADVGDLGTRAMIGDCTRRLDSAARLSPDHVSDGDGAFVAFVRPQNAK